MTRLKAKMRTSWRIQFQNVTSSWPLRSVLCIMCLPRQKHWSVLVCVVKYRRYAFSEIIQAMSNNMQFLDEFGKMRVAWNRDYGYPSRYHISFIFSGESNVIRPPHLTLLTTAPLPRFLEAEMIFRWHRPIYSGLAIITYLSLRGFWMADDRNLNQSSLH